MIRLSFVAVFFCGILSVNMASAENHKLTPPFNSNINYPFQQPDSGFFSKLSKGYEIASNISLEDLGNMANMVIFSKKKNVDAIVGDVTNYLNQLSTANKQIKNIKINKNTKIYVKRDK